MSSAGQFSVSNGQIIDPNGNPFVARGINVFPGQVDAATILQTFPGINAVRVAATPGTDPGTLDSLVQGLTAKGVVVLIEDHSSSGGNPNTMSGQALANEASWYGGLASKYQNNPDVWFGTANEPDNSANLQAIPDQEKAIYDAIRGTGSKAMVMLEERGGGYSEDAVAQSAGTYASMTNVAWDTHYYGWLTGYSTDSSVIAKSIQSQINLAQSVRSADGLVPVIIGEYGPSTTGIAGYDANGMQVVQAVDNSGKGTFAWAYNAGTDALTNGSGLTDFGQVVSQHIAAGGSAAPTVPPPTSALTPPATTPGAPPSNNGSSASGAVAPSAPAPAAGTTPGTGGSGSGGSSIPNGLKLTFDDEFNNLSSSPDGSSGTWATTYPFGGAAARTLPANHEAEYYSDPSVGENPFSVNNGVLTISATPAASKSDPAIRHSCLNAS